MKRDLYFRPRFKSIINIDDQMNECYIQEEFLKNFSNAIICEYD